MHPVPDPNAAAPSGRGHRTGRILRRLALVTFHGTRQSVPTVVACFDDGCYGRIGGGGERGVAVLNRAVMLSPRGIDVGILAHELSHVELHHRLGDARAQVPQWFDEGLAVIAGDDRRYIGPPGAADRCLVRADGPSLPRWTSGWRPRARTSRCTPRRRARSPGGSRTTTPRDRPPHIWSRGSGRARASPASSGSPSLRRSRPAGV